MEIVEKVHRYLVFEYSGTFLKRLASLNFSNFKSASIFAETLFFHASLIFLRSYQHFRRPFENGNAERKKL